MINRLLKLLFRVNWLKDYRAMDAYGYLKRLAKPESLLTRYWRYRHQGDYLQHSSKSGLVATIENQGKPLALFHCNPDSTIDREILKYGQFHKEILDLLTLFSNSQGIVLDVGANIGAYAIPLTKLTGVRVCCFEPNPYVADVLRKNILLNNLTELVDVRALALGESAGQLKLYLPEGDNQGLASLRSDVSGIRVESDHVVEVVALDQIEATFNAPVCAIKIDVQGHEVSVLNGAKGLIRRHRPKIILEHEDHLFNNVKSAEETKERLSLLFQELGYDVYYVSNYRTPLLLPVRWDRPLNGDLVAIPRLQ